MVNTSLRNSNTSVEVSQFFAVPPVIIRCKRISGRTHPAIKEYQHFRKLPHLDTYPLINVCSLRTGKSPSLSSVNQLQRTIFNELCEITKKNLHEEDTKPSENDESHCSTRRGAQGSSMIRILNGYLVDI